MNEDLEKFELTEVDFSKPKKQGRIKQAKITSLDGSSTGDLYSDLYSGTSGSTVKYWAVGLALVVIAYILNFYRPSVWTDPYAFGFSVLVMVILVAVSLNKVVKDNLGWGTTRVIQRICVLIGAVFLFDLFYGVDLWGYLNVETDLLLQFQLDLAFGLGFMSIFLFGQAAMIWNDPDFDSAEKASKLIMPISVIVIALLPWFAADYISIPEGAMNPGDRMNAIFGMLFTSNMAVVNVAFILLGTIATIASINRKSSQTWVSVAQMTMAGIPAIITALILTGTVLPPEDFVTLFTESMDPAAEAPMAILGLIWALANTSVWIIILSIMSVFIDGARVLSTDVGD
ncbi:MAG: hypothetical protein GF364_01605 [Candidatus Lokiarchaeota archaeon]|nr:hypothetical protein [Candidatus Lokiarchaeota archaeon]